MDLKKRRPSRRSRAARHHWQRHLSAQRRSGQNQASYCRRVGLDPRYFSVWKGKLSREARDGGDFRHSGATPGLVPVHIQRTAAVERGQVEVSDSPIAVRVRLPNGITVEVQPSSSTAMTALLGELARLSC